MSDDQSKITRTDAITEAIYADIRSGVYQLGDRLPSYRELAQQYGVSESTIQRIIYRMEALGVLRGHQGKGTFVDRIP